MLGVTSTRPSRPFARRTNTVVVVVAVFFALILGLFGGVLVGVSQKDYTAYTERATATISDVVKRTGGGGTHHRSTTYRIYLDYEAGGQSFTRKRMEGVITGTPHVGDTVELLYPPGQPAKAVTAKTTSKTTAHVELGIGLGLLVLAAGILVGLLVWGRRARRREKSLSAGPWPGGGASI